MDVVIIVNKKNYRLGHRSTALAEAEADERRGVEPAKHGSDWSDWQEGDDGDSCLCGYNGTFKECATSRTEPAKQDQEGSDK